MKFKKIPMIITAVLMIATIAIIPSTHIYGKTLQPTDVITRGELDSILMSYAQKVEDKTVDMVNKTAKSGVIVSSYIKKDGIINYFDKDALQGSGFFISNKYILTNNHVTGGWDKVLKIKTQDNGPTYDAKLIYTDETKDLSLLEIQDYNSDNYLTLGPQPKLGQTVYTVGNPTDFTFMVTRGIVSKENSYNLTQLDINIDHGSSGGPVVNNNGQLIGIIKSRAKNYTGIGFAIKVDEVEWFAKYCIEYGGADAIQINEFLGLTSHP